MISLHGRCHLAFGLPYAELNAAEMGGILLNNKISKAYYPTGNLSAKSEICLFV